MFMILAMAPFNLLAFRGYSWLALVLMIPAAALAGLLDAPPNLDELRFFASDFMKLLTKAAFCSVLSFAVCKLVGRPFPRSAHPRGVVSSAPQDRGREGRTMAASRAAPGNKPASVGKKA